MRFVCYIATTTTIFHNVRNLIVMEWHKLLNADPALEYLDAINEPVAGFIFVRIRQIYSQQKGIVSKELIIAKFQAKYEREIKLLIRRKYIRFTRGNGTSKLVIDALKNAPGMTQLQRVEKTERVLNVKKQLSSTQNTTPHKTERSVTAENLTFCKQSRVEQSRVDKSRVEQSRKDEKNDCDALLFSDFKVFNNWLEKAFDSTNKSNTKFQRDSYDIFTRYRRTDWKNKNGEQIQNKKGICIAAMKAKKYKLKL